MEGCCSGFNILQSYTKHLIGEHDYSEEDADKEAKNESKEYVRERLDFNIPCMICRRGAFSKTSNLGRHISSCAKVTREIAMNLARKMARGEPVDNDIHPADEKEDDDDNNEEMVNMGYVPSDDEDGGMGGGAACVREAGLGLIPSQPRPGSSTGEGPPSPAPSPLSEHSSGVEDPNPEENPDDPNPEENPDDPNPEENPDDPGQLRDNLTVEERLVFLYPCPVCDLRYESRKMMNTHITLRHQENVAVRPLARKRGKRNFKQAPLGTRSNCPVDGCKVNYKKPKNIRVHLKRDHGMTETQVKHFSIVQTKELCPNCGKGFSNLYKHLVSCKVKNIIEICISANLT